MRSAISASRAEARASIRLATFEHATSNSRSPQISARIKNGRRNRARKQRISSAAGGSVAQNQRLIGELLEPVAGKIARRVDAETLSQGVGEDGLQALTELEVLASLRDADGPKMADSSTSWASARALAAAWASGTHKSVR